MVQIVQQTRKQKIKMYMGLPKSKLAELLYNCNEAIAEMMAHQKPYAIAPQEKGDYAFINGKYLCPVRME